MNVLSLFDGISCGRLALERAEIKVKNYYTSEIDKYAAAISRYNHSTNIELGDITKIDIEKLKTLKIDMVVGGSPCQDLSIAGSMKGLGGTRSGLFYTMAEIIKKIKPKYFLLENVVMGAENENIISTIMNVKPTLINSADFSAQNRERLYWFNWDIKPYIAKNIVINDVLDDNIDKKYIYKNNKIYAAIKNIYEKSNSILAKYNNTRKSENIQRIGTVGKGSQGQRIYSTNAKSIALSAVGGAGLYLVPAITSNSYEHNNFIKDEFCVRKLTPLECERLQTLPDMYTKYGIDEKGNKIEISDTQRYKSIGNGWTVDVVSHILQHCDYHNTEVDIKEYHSNNIF